MYFVKNLHTGNIAFLTSTVDACNFFNSRRSLAWLRSKAGRVFYIGSIPYTLNMSLDAVQKPPVSANRSRYLRYNIYSIKNLDDDESQHQYLDTVIDKEQVREYARIAKDSLDWRGLEDGKTSFIVNCGKQSKYQHLRVDMVLLNCNYQFVLDRLHDVAQVFQPGKFVVTELISGQKTNYRSCKEFSQNQNIAIAEIYRTFHGNQALRRNGKFFLFADGVRTMTPNISRCMMLYQIKHIKSEATSPAEWSDPVTIRDISSRVNRNIKRVREWVSTITSSDDSFTYISNSETIFIIPYRTTTTIPYEIIEHGQRSQLVSMEHTCK